MMRLEIQALTKTYGAIEALHEVDLAAADGELLALVGPDGAGKTTLFRAACGLIEYDRGEIRIIGHDINRDFNRVKPHLGYMPQNFSLYPDLSVEENLSFYAGLFGLDRNRFDDKKKRLYEFSGLGPFSERRAGMLSGGMKQKLALSCNLIHDPEVLLLDEPTTGVDPLSRRQFWDILKNLKEAGSTIVVSTPYMDEVALADRAVMIYDGRILAEGTPDKLRGMFRGTVYQVGLVPDHKTMRALDNFNGLEGRRFGSALHLYLAPERSLDEYTRPLSEIGIKPEMLTAIEPELEDTFIQLMER